MLKFASIIIAICALNGAFLELPSNQQQLISKKNSDKTEQQPARRELIEPALCIATVLAISFLIGFIVGRIKWRKNTDYQSRVFQLTNKENGNFEKSIFHVYTNIFTKDLVNRCYVIIKSLNKPEDIENQKYFLELCSAWGHFTRNHILITIKLFDIVYNLQFFDLFLTRETLVKRTEHAPETVRQRNKRFIEIITTEMEGNARDRDTRFSQTSVLRLMNNFYGGFAETILYEMFDKNLKPVKTNLIPSERLRKEKFGCFSFFGI